MKVLVIPDVHLKPWIFVRANEIMKTGMADKAVCLMDIPDDWDQEFNLDLYDETFDAAVQFQKQNQDTLWCYGNHDLSYVWNQPESGFSPLALPTVNAGLRRLMEALPDLKQIAYVHRIDSVLFMHGGLTAKFVEFHAGDLLSYSGETLDGRGFDWNEGLAGEASGEMAEGTNNGSAADESGIPAGSENASERSMAEASGKSMAKETGRNIEIYAEIDAVLERINSLGGREIWEIGSPIWFRPQVELEWMYRQDDCLQVVGHTPTTEILKERNFISCDVFSTYHYGEPIGTQEFLLVDTKTWEYKGVK